MIFERGRVNPYRAPLEFVGQKAWMYNSNKSRLKKFKEKYDFIGNRYQGRRACDRPYS